MKELDLVQVTQLKRIAEQLLETRQQKSISLDAVATATYIPQRLLQALEAEQFERLPEPVYVQGFIRRYADYLGLDGRALSQTFELNPIVPSAPTTEPSAPPVVVPPLNSSAIPSDASRQSVDPPATNSAVSQPVSEPSALPERSTANIVEPAIGSPKSAEVDATSGVPSVDSPPQPSVPVPLTPPLHSETTPPIQPASVPPVAITSTSSPPVVNASATTRSPKRPVAPLVLAGGAIVLLGLGAMAILNRPRPTDRPTVSTTTSDLTANVSPSPAPSVAPEVAPGSPTTPSVTNAPVQVAVNLTDRSWLEVIVDGKVEVEDVKEKGFQNTWTAERELFIRSGNAGAVIVSFNQADPKPMGQVGQVEEITYTPDSTAATATETDTISQSAAEPPAEQLQSSSPN
ncbi:RodZ domain-containing protein [Pantanalinema rosaneae CENA516]|uniref:helix-turn-helix domain-containing protein n=1 Tax=Pantanalinema rosaneae TaxID=1620701 RepID=UPI003D6E2C9D